MYVNMLSMSIRMTDKCKHCKTNRELEENYTLSLVGRRRYFRGGFFRITECCKAAHTRNEQGGDQRDEPQ